MVHVHVQAIQFDMNDRCEPSIDELEQFCRWTFVGWSVDWEEKEKNVLNVICVICYSVIVFVVVLFAWCFHTTIPYGASMLVESMIGSVGCAAMAITACECFFTDVVAATSRVRTSHHSNRPSSLPQTMYWRGGCKVEKQEVRQYLVFTWPLYSFTQWLQQIKKTKE